MVNSATRFAYLLNRIGMRPGQLASQTGLDKTLISRWRTGQRAFPPSGEKSDLVVRCLMADDAARAGIERVLMAYGYTEATGSIEQNLAYWLSELPSPTLAAPIVYGDSSSLQYTTNVAVYLGFEGLRNAAMTMMDYVASLPQSMENTGEVMVYLQGDQPWFKRSEAFRTAFYYSLTEGFLRGVSLVMIQQEHFSPQDIAPHAGGFLAAHLRGQIKSYDVAAPAPCNGVVAATPSSACIRVVCDENVKDSLYTSLHTDPVTVRQAHDICQKALSKAVPRYQLQFLRRPGQALEKVEAAGLLAAHQYSYASTPFFGCVPAKELRQWARLPEKRVKPVRDSFLPLLYTPEDKAPHAANYQCFSLGAITEVLQEGRTRHPVLSALCGTEINYAKKPLAETLLQMVRWLKELDDYQVALLPGALFSKVPLEYLCVQDNLTVAWLADGKASVNLTQPHRREAMWLYAKRIWDEIPAEYKDKENVCAQLTVLARQYAVG